MDNLILSKTPVDITAIKPGVNYAENATGDNVFFNKVTILKNNKFFYTTADNSVLNINHTNFSGSTGNILNITSNTNTNGKGVAVFDDNIYSVDGGSFNALTGLTSVNIKKAIPNLNCNSMFYSCSNLSGVSLDTSKVTNMTNMFYYCSKLSGVSLDTSNVTNMSGMFNSCSNLSGVSLDTSNVTNMSNMFQYCSNLSGVSLDTSKVTNMGWMFYYCSNLSGVSLSNTSNVTNMSAMFVNCRNLSGVSLSNTSKVTNMSGMFQDCNNLSGVSLSNTSKVTNMSYMFNSCSNLSGVSLSNTSNVTDMSNMFQYCNKLSGVSLDTSKVTNMSAMFQYCNKLKTINITNFGKVSGLNGTVDFSTTIWGQTSSSDTTADATAVQSIRDTLITNSFDRKTAGYSVLTIQLNSTTLGYLTDAEKSSITNKGYTLLAV